MAGSIADEDEEVLDISEQTRRPLDGALKQQRIRAWSPYLDPWIVIGALFAIAAITIPVGTLDYSSTLVVMAPTSHACFSLSLGYFIQALSNGVVELKIQYDKFDDPNALCHIDTPNANRTCQLSFTAPKDMNPPILVHYELTNFNQNHRKYMSSRDNYQVRISPTRDHEYLASSHAAFES
jgi:LEM3 (ligand-effect modulator 3) family / CDC50 family